MLLTKRLVRRPRRGPEHPLRYVTLLLLLALVPYPGCARAELRLHPGYRYLMYSDPMYVKFDDGVELKLQVTASATRLKDTLWFSINNEIVDENYLALSKRRATLRHEFDGMEIRALCTSRPAVDLTFNHVCAMAIDGESIGRLNVNKRMYPKDGR